MTHTQWLRIRSLLDTCSGLCVGKDAHGCLFVEALRWMARMRTWACVGPAYGKGNSVYGRYAAWCHQGLWPRLRAHLQTKPDLSAVLRDSPIVHAHVSAAGAPPKKKVEPARDRRRGSFGTRILILADRRGRSLHLRVTGGQHHDSTQARALVERSTRPCPA